MTIAANARTIALGLAAFAAGSCLAQSPVPQPLVPDATSGRLIAARQARLDALPPVTDADLLHPADGEWVNWRRTYDGQGFSPLTQIDASNVANLRPAWTWSMPPNSSQNTPLVHAGVMFVYGVGDRVQALDAKTGDLLWEHTHIAKRASSIAGIVKRSIAMGGDKIFVATTDGQMIALDMHSGKQVWATELGGKEVDISSGPMVVRGKVIQGLAGCTRIVPGGCSFVALDAETGKLLWTFHTLARAGEPGGDTWNDLPFEKRNGGSIWSTATYDPGLNLIYIGVGNSYNWQDLTHGVLGKDTHKSDGLYTNSTLAVDPDTGKLKWYYQHLPGETWDLDFAFERTIADIVWQGKTRHVVITTGKAGITDVLDAATGKWLYSLDQGVQNVVKAIDPKTGRKIYNPAAMPDITLQRTNLQCPAGFGAKNYPSNSFNPASRILYIPLAENCGESIPKIFKPGEYTGQGQELRVTRYPPNSDGNIGRLDAVDMQTGKTLWSTRQRASVTGAALATAGRLVFAGDADRWFKAYDDKTGTVLWQMRLNDAITSYPISYAVDGRQYVAILAGNGGPRIPNLRAMTPEINTPRGGGAVMWVFELPEKP